MLGRVMEAPNFSADAFAGMEAITYGAAPMPPSVIRRAIGEFPLNVSFAGAYGQTETTSTTASAAPTPFLSLAVVASRSLLSSTELD